MSGRLKSLQKYYHNDEKKFYRNYITEPGNLHFKKFPVSIIC